MIDVDFYEIDYLVKGIRVEIMDKKKKVFDLVKFIIVIKLIDDVNFKNIVDILDEMVIIDNQIYVIVDFQ